MSRLLVVPWLLPCLLWLCAASGCDRCGGPDAIAELRSVTGEVTVDDAATPVAFAPATVGHLFVVDEAVHTASAATAELSMAGGGSLHVEPETTVRFSRNGERSRVVVESGSALVEAGETAPLEFETSFGTARIEAGGRARLGDDASRFEVLVGRARLETEGRTLELAAGETASSPEPTTLPTTNPSVEPADDEALRDVEVRGAAASVRAPDAEGFVTLAVGSTRVAEGSVLRGSEGTTLDIATTHGRVRVEGVSELRLTEGEVALSHGSASVEGSDGMRVELPGGALVLRGRASADVDVETDGSGTIAMLSGEARHEGAEGERALSAPDVVTLAPTGADVVEGGPGPNESPDGSPAESPAESPGSEAHADVTVVAGESVAIHDPRGRTSVRVSPPSGCGEASYRFEGPRHPPASTSSGPIVVQLGAGTFRYRVRCSSGPSTNGSIRVDRDAGRTSLPRTAPRTVVDADGRSYSVLYQTRLPEIVVRWPRSSGPCELEVRRGSSSRRIRLSTPTHTFSSGELPEGRHTLTFHGSDGSSSPVTPVVIRFDNTTPVATIRLPTPTDALGAVVHVAGTAAERAQVSIEGRALASDEGGRFEADVPTNGACIAIRVELSGRGIHYYMRCGRNG